MAKPLPFKGTKLSYMWRYRHGDTAAVVPDSGQQQPADLDLQDFVCTCQAGVHPTQTNLQFSNCHSLMDVLRYLFRKVQYPNVTEPSWTFTAKVGGNTVVMPGTHAVVFAPTNSYLKYSGNDCPQVTDNGTFSTPQYTNPDGNTIASGGNYNFTLPANANAKQQKTFSGTRDYTTGNTSPQDNTGADCRKTDLANPPQASYPGLTASAKITVDLPFYYGWEDDNGLGRLTLYLFQNTTAQTFTIPAQSASNAKPKFFILIPPTHASAQITLKNTSGNETDAQLATRYTPANISIGSDVYGYTVKCFAPTESYGIPLKLTIKP